MLRRYSVSDLVPYINWIYFFHAWSIPPKYAGISNVHGCDACRRQWVMSFPTDEQPYANEVLSLFKDAMHELSGMSGHVSIKGVIELFQAASRDDDILIFREGTNSPFVLPMLRQQRPGPDGYCLSLADFLPTVVEGCNDRIGVFATSVSQEAMPVSASESVRPSLFASTSADDYRRLLIQTLSDRLAEAGAERLHQEVRQQIWGYAPHENLTIEDLHAGRYEGIRPAVGYPCMPDISLNFLLGELIDFKAVGIQLTEHGMMIPHASVSGLMLSSPAARYFTVGTVLDDQLTDYAQRRNIPVEEMRKYISLKFDY